MKNKTDHINSNSGGNLPISTETSVRLCQRCVIITSYCDRSPKKCVAFRPDDYIICADGGYALAEKDGINVDLVVGDFDSYTGAISEKVETFRVAAEKDDTDTMLCLKIGIEKGFNDFVICGGVGGRLDHTIGNLQVLAYAVHEGKQLWIHSGNDHITMICGSRLTIGNCQALKAKGYKFSLFSYTQTCTGVCIRGAFYPLDNATLCSHIPVGVSNEFMEDSVIIENQTGCLLVILSKEAY